MLINNLLIIISFIATSLILIGGRWELRAAGLAMVELVVFILIIQIWPIALASVKLIAGWMGIILISASQLSKSQSEVENSPRSEAIFRMLTAVIIWVVVSTTAASFNEWIPIPYTNLYIGLVIISAGLIFVSTTFTFINIVLGILTILDGFDLIYSSLEGSALVTAIFALIIIFVALLNTYFSSGSGEAVQ